MEPKTDVDPCSLLEHKDFVRAVVRGLLADEQAVDDVVQETCLRAIENPPRHTALRAWLARVGRNLALTALRAQRRRGYREREAARPERQPSAVEAASRLERHRLVVEAVLALEEPFRSAILLRFYDDLKPREIARQLGVPVDTVRSRLRRGVERMRAWFDERHGGDRAAWSLLLLPLLGAHAPTAATAAAPTGGGTKVLDIGGTAMTLKAKLAGAAIVLFAIAAGVITWQAARDRPTAARTDTRRAVPAEGEAPFDRADATATVENPATLPDRGIGLPGQAPGVSIHQGSSTTGPFNSTTGPQIPKPYRIAEPCGEADRGALRVVVTDGAGNPLPGAKLLAGIFKDGRIDTGNYEADASGRLELRSLEPGKWSVSALSKSQHRIAMVEIETGRFTEVAVTLAGGATVEGTVSHVERGPLAEVLMSIEREEAGFHDYFNATTDAQGRYRLEGVPPGNYAVKITGKLIGYDQRPRATLAVPGPGAVTQDIVLGRIALSGTVRDADTGAPVAGVTVQFQGPWYGKVATDNDGTYSVADLAPANYKLCLLRDGYGTEFGETGPITPDVARTADFTLRRAAVLLLEVLDGDGRPMAGSVMLGVTSAGSTTSLGTFLDVDSTGIGRYPKIVPGPYDIDVWRHGYVRQKQRIEIKPGENRLTFRLERDPAAPEGRLSLQGTVRDSATGRPIAGARVTMDAGTRSEGLTDADGRYRLLAAPPGKWTLIVSRDGYGVRAIRGVEVAAEPRTEDFALDPAAVLHIYVTDSAGRPVVGGIILGVRGATENLTNIGTGIEADADGHGVYKQIVPGRYGIRVFKENAGEAKVDLEIVPGENVLRVRLE